MKRSFVIILTFIILLTNLPQDAYAYMVKYKEDWYRLYHVHYQQYPDDCMENIYWLEKAAQADFCNPQFADIKITTEKEWEKYRYLFQMHINLKLIDSICVLVAHTTKNAFIFTIPRGKMNIFAIWKKHSYKAGLYYWQEAKLWQEKANAASFNFLFITGKQNWEDERERIATGDLNYEKMLNREIERLEKNIKELNEMDKKY